MNRLLLFTLFIVSTLPLSAQLSGAYTIGGTNPNYADFTAAAAALTTQGISGNVTFNVRPGTYTERFIINAIPGSNVNRTVTFQAENGDSSSVLLLNATATNTTNYLIALQNVGQVVLKRLSFQTPETGAYSTAVLVYNASNIRLENCRLSGSLNTSTLNENQRISVLVTGISPNFTAKNCFFRNGYNGIGVLGGETLVSADMLIENNRFKGTIGEAVAAVYAHNIRVRQNLVDSCALGFSIRFCSTAVVIRNRIFTTYYGCLAMYECRGTAANRCLVANNMMGNYGNSTQVNGALIQSCRYLDFFHNSLDIQSGSEQCYGLFLANSSRYIRIQNNSVVVKPGGLPVVVQNEPNEVETFSHCNLYNGLILTDLPPNSISANPYYAGNTDLHVANAVLNNLGTPLPTVTVDFDGENRSATAPDIGADEYVPVQISAAVGGFVNPSADSVYCAELPLEIVLQNTGSTTLTSAVLTVTLNGVAQPDVAWTGNLAVGQTTQVALGFPALVPLQSNTVSVQCSNPNGSADNFPADDKLVFDGLYSGLSGTYTIGGNNPDFTSFSAAVAALQKGGLCSNTTLLVRNGTYNEQIQIGILKGSSAQHVVTFQGESGDSSAVILSAPASANNAFTLRTQYSRFLTFKSLKIKQTANTNNYSPVFIAFGSDITFENCIIEGYFGNNSSDSDAALAAFPDSNLTVRNCLIRSGGMGANLVGTGPLKYNLVFENNRVYGSYDDCLNLQKWQNVRVRNNEFGASSQNSLYGIYGLNLYNYEISGNRISIFGVQATNGIYLINCAEYNDDISLVANNSISMNLGAGIVAVSRGMWIINCDSIHVIHNTIRHNSADTDNIAFEIQQTSGAYVVNNVFVNSGLGLAFNSGGTDYSFFDHNVYFTNGALVVYGSAELSGIQTQTGGDQHSVLANPMWTNGLPDSLSLHNPILENIGTQTVVLTDLRGFARQFPNPDPGAFETPSAPVVQLGPDRNACGQTVLHGFAPGASSYLWNTGATTADLTVDSSGMYILTATNDIGSATDTIVVQVFPLPLLFAGPDISVCSGASVDINTSSSGTCQWSDLAGIPVSDDCLLSLTISVSGAFVLTVTDDNNCVSRDTVQVTAFPLPTVEAAPDISVCSESLTFITGTSSGSCTWSDLGGNMVSNFCNFAIDALESTVYVLSTTSQDGCMASDTLFLHVDPNPAPPVITANGNVLSTVSNDALQWWLGGTPIPGATGPTYVPTETGTYTVQATTAAGCSATSAPYFFVVSGTVELSDSDLTVFPNPVAGKTLFIHVSGQFRPDGFALFDARGRLINNGPVVAETSGRYVIPAPVETGMYFLKISDASGKVILKKVQFF
ncbi:MAG TPA: right-handed parallel beta-helix repeat-containing protein [Saprospiraceae bacterium]|nr:right-handed parallel beta-helix repeat-containing protein [Saprospiraceae bacterium]HPI07176.1 right-handed parallel beta-helix repeat-containing protein [Saprospiraceae bacterium]